MIVEPVLSAGGMLVPPPGYLKALRDLAHANGALFIVDEAQTGFGRTGKWFAIEHHGVEPDIMTISKSIGNGFPVAAVITTAEIADDVVAKGLWNLSSHQSDPAPGSGGERGDRYRAGGKPGRAGRRKRRVFHGAPARPRPGTQWWRTCVDRD